MIKRGSFSLVVNQFVAADTFEEIIIFKIAVYSRAQSLQNDCY